MPKVYCTNYNGSYDYSAAEKFGTVIHMTQGFVPPHRHDAIMQVFENYAKTANSEDYLLLSGSNLVCAIATVAWLNYNPGIRLLQHMKVKGVDGTPQTSYVSYNVTLSD
jgi:hypothetical protein